MFVLRFRCGDAQWVRVRAGGVMSQLRVSITRQGVITLTTATGTVVLTPVEAHRLAKDLRDAVLEAATQEMRSRETDVPGHPKPIRALVVAPEDTVMPEPTMLAPARNTYRKVTGGSLSSIPGVLPGGARIRMYYNCDGALTRQPVNPVATELLRRVNHDYEDETLYGTAIVVGQTSNGWDRDVPNVR
jgi:hypothetical protein